MGSLWTMLALVGIVTWRLGATWRGGSSVTQIDVLLLLSGSAVWGLAWWRARDLRLTPRAVAVLCTGAFLLKAAALGTFPLLSDDAYRYVWEGALVAQGQSPYAVAPADVAPELRPFGATNLLSKINHPEVPAAYPPLTQAFHAATVSLAARASNAPAETSLRALGWLGLLFDVLVLLLLATKLAPSRAGPLVAWGYCPWLAFEFAGMAHFDVLGILLLVAALSTRRSWLSAIGLAAGGLVKFLPLIAVPWIARRSERPLVVWALAVLVTAAGWASVLLLDGGFPSGRAGLAEYAFRWESWNLSYRWLEGPLHTWLDSDESWSDPRRVGRALVAVLFTGWALRVWLREREPVEAARLLIAAFLFLSPTLHPWYLAWGLVFFALRPSLAWGWVFVCAPLAYLPLEGWQTRGVWSEPGWLMPLVTVPFLLLAAWEARARRRL